MKVLIINIGFTLESYKPPFLTVTNKQPIKMYQTLNQTEEKQIQKEEICLEDYLKSLIEVTEPYYALTNLSIDEENILKADVNKQLDCDHEVKGMSYSEAGRHLAILGSLALANSNPLKEKHYYLATKAYVKRVYQQAYDEIEHVGYMSTIHFDRKKGIAKGYLNTKTGKKIYTITVEYQVLSGRLFERMFKQHKQVTPCIEGYNPYRERIPLFDLKTDKESCSATLGVINKDICVGHFDDYPALPVARIAQVLTSIAGIQNNASGLQEPMKIKHVILYAKSFLFAGESMSVKSVLESSTESSDENVIDTFAFSNDDTEYSARLTCWI